MLDAFTWSRYRALECIVEQAYANPVTDTSDQYGAGRRFNGTVITDARSGASQEMSQRIRRYTITMGFRIACFISMIFVEGPFRWVLFAGAVVLPYIAVILANQANRRTPPASKVEHAEPNDHRQLTVGEGVEVISGDLLDDSSHFTNPNRSSDSYEHEAPAHDRNVA